MDTVQLAELLFPAVTETPEEVEARYPVRQLPEGAAVTRFAPSPTGFVHFGGLFPVTIGERLAHQSGGVFYLRIEDTDAKREIPGAAEALVRTLGQYGIRFDEGETSTGEQGDYGPYRQSHRASLYHVYAKKLVAEGHAYPCFTTAEELAALQETDHKALLKERDWQQDAARMQAEQEARRAITEEEVRTRLAAGDPFVLRLRADGDAERRIPFTDLVRGKLEIPENTEDFVLLKSDGIPTYHFAHAVDDHLMRTTHVIRGEEWLPSLAKHLMLFRYLGFRLPKYLHIAQLMKMDENGSKKKLSKRDLGANLEDYRRLGYDPECVMEYVLTLLNSDYEAWRLGHPDAPYTDYPFRVRNLSASGCLFDFAKLNDVSRNTLSRRSAAAIYEGLTAWAAEYDPAFAALLTADPAYTLAILGIGRGGRNPRKDFATWGEVRPYIGFFFDPLFRVEEEYPAEFDRAVIRRVLERYLELYDHADGQDEWFAKIRTVTGEIGFATDTKAYRADPTAWPGSVVDVSMFLRVALTGRRNAPDMYTVMQILGEERVRARIAAMAASLA